MDFLTGLTNLTNWAGNVIMPTLAGLFFVISVLPSRGARPSSTRSMPDSPR
jgi:hypothetical protein